MHGAIGTDRQLPLTFTGVIGRSAVVNRVAGRPGESEFQHDPTFALLTTGEALVSPFDS
ncbi:MAG TPA: hypothetical protein VFP42_11600 [Acidimicrobiia bacterium]|nr:hypothetical protein [Acidimicrobiia bacterium]